MLPGILKYRSHQALTNHVHTIMQLLQILSNAARSLPAILLLSILCVAIPAQAKKSDLSQPIDINADRSEIDETRGVTILIGDVQITQGTMKISAERVEIFLKNNQVSNIEGTGSPIRYEQENEAGELIVGEANNISFDAIASILILSGGATLSQPRQELKSERIEFNAATQKVSAEGGSNGRVNIRIQPPSGN